MELSKFLVGRFSHRMLFRLAFLILVIASLVMLAGCRLPAETNRPAAVSTGYLSTAVALTVQAADTSRPTNAMPASANLSSRTAPAPSPPASGTASPTSAGSAGSSVPTPSPDSASTGNPVPPSSTPTIFLLPASTQTPIPFPELPGPAIEIIHPGPASKVVSPIQLSANLNPGDSGKVRVELIGEDGRLLFRQILTYADVPRVFLQVDIEFEIAAVAETARLQVLTEDTFGRIVSLSSVDVVLLSIGDDDLNPSVDTAEPIIIREPGPNTLIQGGEVQVSGLARPAGTQPLLIELVTRDKRIVGYRQAAVDPPAGGTHGEFSISVPYNVSATTWVRLTITESNSRIAGPTHISSIEVLLSP